MTDRIQRKTLRIIGRSFIVCFAVLAAGLALSACSDTQEPASSTVMQTTLLAGRATETTLYTRVSDRPGQKALVVAGMIGDLPGASQAVAALRTPRLAGGHLNLVPEANKLAIAAGRRSAGGDLNRSFGTNPPGQLRDLATTLQGIADTCDILITVTDMREDVGNTILYSEDAPATTAAVTQGLAEAINRKLGQLAQADGVEYDEFYSASINHTSSFIGWASARRQPAMAIELALFGGRDETLAATTQRRLSELALTVILSELGILPSDAVNALFQSPGSQSSTSTETPTEPVSNTAGLHYTLNGQPGVHVPGDLWSLPQSGRLHVVGMQGSSFAGTVVDITGAGSADDTGADINLGQVAGTTPAMLEVRYLRNGRAIWTELVPVGGSFAGEMVLQDTIGTNPWITSFPSPESWLYLTRDGLPESASGCAACDIPASVRLRRGEDRRVVGRQVSLRTYRLSNDGQPVGVLFATKWRDTQRLDLVDITDVNDRHNLYPPIAVEMKYATTDNFLHADVYGGINRCLIKRDVAEALVLVQQNLAAQGLGLKVLDCYRPHPVQFRMWEILPQAGYVAPPQSGSNHNRGGAVDVTLVDSRGRERRMPTEFDSFTPQAWQAATEGLTQEQIQNKVTLRSAMTARGFTTVRKEWWHYNGPNHRRYTVNMSIMLDAGYSRMGFPSEWRQVRLAMN